MNFLIGNMLDNWIIPFLFTSTQVVVYLLLGRAVLKKWNLFPASFLTLNMTGIAAFTLLNILGMTLITGKELVFLWLLFLCFGILLLAKDQSLKDLTRQSKKNLRSTIRAEIQRFKKASVLNKVLFIVLSLLLGLLFTEIIVNGLSPSKVGDSIQGYLGSAKWYYLYGMEFNPYNTRYWVFPFFAEINFSFSFYLGNEIAAKILDVYFAFLVILAIHDYAKSIGINRVGSLLAILLFILYNPGDAGFLWNVGVAKVDVFGTLGAMYFIINLRCLLNSWNEKYVYLGSIGLMMAIGTKYSLWIILMPFILLFLYLLLKQAKVKEYLISGALISMGLLPSMIRNYVYVGNPTAPEEIVWNNDFPINTHDFMTQLGSLEYFVHNMKALYLSPVFIIGLLVLLIRFVRLKRQDQMIYAVSFLSFSIWLFYAGEAYNTYRFWFILLILFSTGMVQAFGTVQPGKNHSLLLLLWLLIPSMLVQIVNYWRYLYGWEYLIGFNDYKQYQDHNNSRGYSLIKELETQAHASAKIFVYDGGIQMYKDRFTFFNTEQEHNQVMSCTNCEKSKVLKEWGFKYVLYRKTGNSEEEWQTFLNDMRLAGKISFMKDDDVVVYKISNDN